MGDDLSSALRGNLLLKEYMRLTEIHRHITAQKIASEEDLRRANAELARAELSLKRAVDRLRRLEEEAAAAAEAEARAEFGDEEM